MPRLGSYTVFYDDVKKINISFLKKHNYLNPFQMQSGEINWSRDGVKHSSISITVCTFENSYLKLTYTCRDQEIQYKVPLVKVPSNLGKGKQWFFQCPRTHLLCRTLYHCDLHFYHRNAFKGFMYESQARSKKLRLIDRVYGSYFKQDNYYDELYSKHFKTHYAGKPTKRYLSLMEKIQDVKEITAGEIESLLMM